MKRRTPDAGCLTQWAVPECHGLAVSDTVVTECGVKAFSVVRLASGAQRGAA